MNYTITYDHIIWYYRIITDHDYLTHHLPLIDVTLLKVSQLY